MTTAFDGRGIILFAHGSRDRLWHQPIEAVAQKIRALSHNTPVLCAYLEFTDPDLQSAVNQLLMQQVTVITILPMFLGIGKHARDDLPALVNQIQSDHRQAKLELRPAVSNDERFVELLALMALESR